MTIPVQGVGRRRVKVIGDEVGLAKDYTLLQLLNALESVGIDKLLTAPDNPPNLDISISSLRDALRGVDNKTLTDLYNRAYDPVADKILTIPDLATLKQSHFNVVNKNAGVSWGFNSLWALVGTPVPATTENVLLDISGSGKCFYVRFMTEYDNMECRIVMDEIRVSAMARERPYYIYTRLGSVGRDGFTELTMYDTTDNKYMIYYNLAQFDMHLFQNSLRISVYNPDTVDHRVCIICDYALLSSPEVFVRDVDIPFESANIRLALTKLTNLKLSAFTVDIHYEWDEKLNRNVKVLSIMNHTGKEDTTNKIINFIVRNYKVRKDRIRVREY